MSVWVTVNRAANLLWVIVPRHLLEEREPTAVEITDNAQIEPEALSEGYGNAFPSDPDVFLWGPSEVLQVWFIPKLNQRPRRQDPHLLGPSYDAKRLETGGNNLLGPYGRQVLVALLEVDADYGEGKPGQFKKDSTQLLPMSALEPSRRNHG
jgi:hypothetical protein